MARNQAIGTNLQRSNRVEKILPRSLMYRKPSSSRYPMSPDRNQPSFVMVRAVVSGSFKYPLKTLDPRLKYVAISQQIKVVSESGARRENTR